MIQLQSGIPVASDWAEELKMQQGITPMPDVDVFDPNADPGGRQEIGEKTTDDIPLPPDVEDREPIEEPEPQPPAVEDPRDPPKQIA